MSEKTIEDGGPAFPRNPGKRVSKWNDFKNSHVWETEGADEPGMTIRDHFAGLAMQGTLAAMCRDDGTSVDEVGEIWLASRAYEIADAMLAQRKAGAL